MASASAGDMTARLAAEPMATPPARVAFCTSTIENLPPRSQREATKAETQEPVSESVVAMTARSWSCGPAGEATKDGQYTLREATDMRGGGERRRRRGAAAEGGSAQWAGAQQAAQRLGAQLVDPTCARWHRTRTLR